MHLSLSSDTTYYDQGEYVLRTSRVLRNFSMVLYIIQRYPDSRPRSQLPLKYSGLVPVEPSSTGGFSFLCVRFAITAGRSEGECMLSECRAIVSTLEGASPLEGDVTS